jgi:hypothetical protein
MVPPDPEPMPYVQPVPIIAVIDSCVFPRRDWLAPILRSARVGYVVPIWSPLIVYEVSRYLTWRWLQQNGGDQSRGARRACSLQLKNWFTEMTALFRVAEDCPPHEETWDSPRDAWDVPIWSAAKRSGAHVIVTENLRDGPPADEQSRRVFQGVLWCHPEVFARVLHAWAVGAATHETPGRDDPDSAAPFRRLLAAYDEATSASS